MSADNTKCGTQYTDLFQAGSNNIFGKTEESLTMAKKQFKTESKKILDLMINSIYTHQEIFLRELISNASDAIDKLCYISLTDDSVGMSREDFRIVLGVSEADRIISVSDNGIGMTKEEMEENLGVIAKSGSLKFKEEAAKEGGMSEMDIIGQFGVGFYSSFMVSDRVTVISRAFGSDTAYKWESTGVDGYTIDECEKDTVGTDVILHIKPDATDESEFSRFLNNISICQLVRKYSDFIRWPIVMNFDYMEEVDTGEKDADGNPVMEKRMATREDIINSMVPIWQRDKDEVSDEEVNDFYQNAFYDYETPVSTIRVNAEGQVTYRAMLFIPGRLPTNFVPNEAEQGLQLYCNGVMIMERCKEVLPECFRFVRGVVDSPDFSLNISREMLQHDRQLRLICNNLEKKIKNELRRLMDDEPEKYERFYNAFCYQLKYNMMANHGDKKELISDLLMYYSSTEKKPVSFRAYKERMPEEQKYLYYVCTDSIVRADNLPQAEQIRDKGYEVLYMTDDLDGFIMRSLREFDGVQFCDITTDDLGLETEDEKEEAEKAQEENKELLEFVKDTIGEAIADVKISHKLRSAPVYLST
ncbi:MAG: molecular chaperone HtpG, partial [Clostridia bacterium]|nr:molecular chaperone HtpG [Clostridia bacterium]